ncbi:MULTISPECIES: hypothetical protein [Streptomyces]|uniref:hypothetical protein n=1 Tax=Streptomyces TaxID=1883 RepID=UPI002888D1B6|nr:hypothetical protein [Streptomyces sp. DSM 41859]MDT0420296.1 hypothetical protein [Streptomyces sp. DSM 41859]
MRRENWRVKLSVLGGAAALALSISAAAPATADDAPSGQWQRVELPVGTIIEDAVAAPTDAPAPTPGGLTKAAPPSDTCLGMTVTYGSSGCFQHYGDIIWAKDTESDGMSAAVVVTTDYGRAPFACVHKGGAGTWGTCNKDYREDGNVKLQVLRYDSDTDSFWEPRAYSGWIPVDGAY